MAGGVTRRGAMLAAGVAAGVAARAAAVPVRATPTAGRDIVLVHGAWHGGWCWRDVAADLRARGHRVFAPTLTGMGERLHLGRADTNVSTHVADILGVLDCEEVAGATLVLHSYAGLPGSVAAGRRAGGIAHVVYLDALFPIAGRASVDDVPPDVRRAAEATLIDGFRFTSFAPEAFGVALNHPAHSWLTRRLTTIPWGCLTEPLPVLEPPFSNLDKHYIAAARNTLAQSQSAAVNARAAGWTMHRLETGHDTMVTMPHETAALIDTIARS